MKEKERKDKKRIEKRMELVHPDVFLFHFSRQLSNHLDLVKGDCQAVEAPCPFHSIGCPDAEVSPFKTRKKNAKFKFCKYRKPNKAC